MHGNGYMHAWTSTYTYTPAIAGPCSVVVMVIMVIVINN